MTEIDLTHQLDGDPAVECDNCDWEGTSEQLETIKDVQERLDPGCPVPAGECPECGALAYLKERPSHLPKELNQALVEKLQAKALLYLEHLPKEGDVEDAAGKNLISFRKGMAVGSIKVLELVLSEHGCKLPDCDVDKLLSLAFQDLLAALREPPQRSRKPERKKKPDKP
jgi:hypothetical protein